MNINRYKNLQSVAIVIPIYNVEKYLKACLDSVLAQTYRNFNVYAIDDGSTDNSGNILFNYSKMDDRIHVVHQKNKGVSSARNLAMDYITESGKFTYIYFLDADDFIDELCIETFVKYMELFRVDYAVCSYQTISVNKISQNNKKSSNFKLLSNLDICEQFFNISIKNYTEYVSDSTTSLFLNNRFFRLDKIKSLRFNENFRACEDQDFLIRAFQLVERGVKIPDKLFYYRRRLSSLSNGNDVKRYDLFAYQLLYKNKNCFPSYIRIGIQKEYLRHLIQRLYYELSSSSSMISKKNYYNYCISILERDLEFPETYYVHKQKLILSKGFLFSLIYSYVKKLLKLLIHYSRRMRFYK